MPELLESILEPGEALSNEGCMSFRAPFHHGVSIENETVLALLMLSTYEYAQRGNIAKMRNRAGQALTAAMNLNLHAKSDDLQETCYTESDRRTWWMTVSNQYSSESIELTISVYHCLSSRNLEQFCR